MKTVFRCMVVSICFVFPLLFSGCGTVKDYEIVVESDSSSDNDNIELKNVSQYGVSPYMACAEDGFYFLSGSIIYFFDNKSQTSVALCTKLNCNHTENSCDAYTDIYTYPNIAWVGYNKGHIFLIKSGGNDMFLYSYDKRFNNEDKFCKLTSEKEEIRWPVIINDYLYYVTKTYNSELTSTYCNIRRIKLSHNESFETIYEADYEADSVSLAIFGIENGLIITERYDDSSNKEHIERYNIKRYNSDTGSVSQVYSNSYVKGSNRFGDEYGKKSSKVIFDKNGDGYCSTTYGILKINLTNDPGKCEFIYESDECTSTISTDGTYIYNWQCKYDKESPVHKIIKLNSSGKIEKDYCLEYDMSKFNGYIGYYDENNVYHNEPASPANASLMLDFFGIYNDNLVISSLFNGFKNLSGDSSIGYIKELNVPVGIGTLNFNDESKDMSVKQIFEYKAYKPDR